jgi:hypothetical protein
MNYITCKHCKTTTSTYLVNSNVCRWCYNKITRNHKVIHHIDGNLDNNAPDNLMTVNIDDIKININFKSRKSSKLMEWLRNGNK